MIKYKEGNGAFADSLEGYDDDDEEPYPRDNDEEE